MAGPASTPTMIELPPLNIINTEVTLVGDSPLIVHRWPEKAKQMILDKQMKKAKQKKEAKDPWADYVDSLYWLSARPAKITPDVLAKATFGFPAVAFKAAAVSACAQIDGITKVFARGAFHVTGEMVTILGKPKMREDMVRIGMGVADIRYRAEFTDWRVKVPVRFNANGLSLDQLFNLFNVAGFAVGIGEWRPERDGSYGMFHVEGHEEVR